MSRRCALDSTSFRQLLEASGRDPIAVGEAIMSDRRPSGARCTTRSPGRAASSPGTVRGGRRRYGDAPPVGTRVFTLVSLTLTPLRLETVGEVDLERTPRARHGHGVPALERPGGRPIRRTSRFDAALAAVDVCNAATQTRALIDADTDTVLVLGGGHAGLLALAAARDCSRPRQRC